MTWIFRTLTMLHNEISHFVKVQDLKAWNYREIYNDVLDFVCLGQAENIYFELYQLKIRSYPQP